MQHVTLWNTLSAPYSILFHMAMFFVMNEYRYPRKKAAVLTVIYNIPILALTIAIYLLYGSERGGQLAPFFYLIPQLTVNYFLSQYRDGRLFLTYFFVNGIFIFIIQVTNLLDHYSPYGNHIVMFLTRLIMYPIALFFMIKVLSKPYRRALNVLNEGWSLFAFISGLFTLLLLLEFNFPDTLSERPYDIPVLIITFVTMVLMNVYYFKMMLKQYDHNMEQEIVRHQKQQVEIMQERIRHTAKEEKTISIYRHDLRHILTTLSEMLAEGNTDEATAFIENHIGVIEETAESRYCAEPVLNAMFRAYFAEADRQGVKVDAEIDITEVPKEEAATFSIVCANLIENATHAVSGLDEDKKLIRVRGVQYPKLMLSISNPYEGSIMTDDEGIPITSRAGHGIGIRSIMDYCEKHDAVCDFKIQDGWFAVRIAKK